ncbi:MAG TPA: flagellar FlbD family protein [Spirochaetota bacterium]|nr:flagellar FlbD family protein [Spirochaetota bacterium]HPC40623.1 flagellar FlbD family protein [Spirochaetota bacterium]HPL18343.1 flagellar FlbD family protein [Spirochaetota bacterium]HQF10265.1 flagellar FlbD family protein [Spirochaetota bacterium]HQH99143.1 flagellar FlbD family protein [Spirochaetota bacterium]
MITLHKLNGAEFILNNNHIETIESTPDSVITLMNEKKYIVKETADEIIQKIREYQVGVLTGLKRVE